MPMQAPNETAFSTDRRMNGSVPLAGRPSPIEPNERRGGDRKANGSVSLAGQASPIQRNHMIPTGNSGQPHLPVTTEPGKGAVPVNPGIAGTMPVAEMARARG